MSYFLGIDTSSTELGVGLADEDRMIAGVSRYVRNSHAEHISRSVEFLLSSCKVKPFQVDFAAIAVGPGSFTGLRIGISFLKGFCFGRPVKVLPVSSLESMAMSWHDRERPIVAAFDARNGEIFWARFVPAGTAFARASDDALAAADDFMKALNEIDIVLIDRLGNEKSTVFDSIKTKPNVYTVEQYPVQRGLACARVGMSAANAPGRWTACSEITPRYLTVTPMEKKLSCAR
jgi:tRNA threonylcarbamoyladenosine biosynthesis protein TsaB